MRSKARAGRREQKEIHTMHCCLCLQELSPQIVAALAGAQPRLAGVEDGEHMFFMREALLQQLQSATSGTAAAAAEE